MFTVSKMFCGSKADSQVAHEPNHINEVELGALINEEDKVKITNTNEVTPKTGKLIVIDPEMFRCIGYVCFWSMMIISIATTKLTVDVPDPNPLELTFGYTNICLYFDYDPPRIVAAMIYPAVEYNMALYVATNWYVAESAFRRHSQFAHSVFTVASMVELVLIAWFRLVFVVRAFDDVVGHTIPFMGLQITLAMIAFQNVTYYNLLHDDEVNWSKLSCTGSMKSYMSVIGWIYAILLFIVTMVKIIITSAVLNGHPLMKIGTSFQSTFGTFFDWSWLLLAAIIPMILSVYMVSEKKRPKLEFYYHGADGVAPAANK